LDWLVGRSIGERDRVPAYGRLQTTFVHRATAETGKKVVLPQPAWVGDRVYAGDSSH
jgi:hypothetical protein